MKRIFVEFKNTSIDFIKLCFELLTLADLNTAGDTLLFVIFLYFVSTLLVSLFLIFSPLIIPIAVWKRMRYEEDMVWKILKGEAEQLHRNEK